VRENPPSLSLEANACVNRVWLNPACLAEPAGSHTPVQRLVMLRAVRANVLVIQLVVTFFTRIRNQRLAVYATPSIDGIAARKAFGSCTWVRPRNWGGWDVLLVSWQKIIRLRIKNPQSMVHENIDDGLERWEQLIATASAMSNDNGVLVNVNLNVSVKGPH
jgi:hypothetical protein